MLHRLSLNLFSTCELTNGKYVIVRLDHDVPTYYYGSLEKVEMTLPKNEETNAGSPG
jgi:hypothetical protein